MAVTTQPYSVIVGVVIFYISLLLGFVGGLINIIHIGFGLSGFIVSNQPPPFGVAIMCGIVLASTAIGWFIIFNINRGRSWARYLYAVLVIIGLIIWTTNFDITVAQGFFVLVAAGINTLLGIIGTVFLFRAEANTWFKKPD